MANQHNTFRDIVASIQKLAKTDPMDPHLSSKIDKINDGITALNVQVQASEKANAPVDMAALQKNVEKLHQAAVQPAKIYRRIAVITHKLHGLTKLASLPQNAAVRPQIQEVVKKCAGIFSEVDTVEDLDKPLETIEKAVHKLYGDQSKNDIEFFDRRGKGNHSQDQ